MGWQIRGGKERKIDLMKEGLMAFCSKFWPLSYYDKPIRLGIVTFRLIGVPGDTKFEVIVPLYPSPMSLELYRLQKIDAKGGCYISDGLKYASIILRESDRSIRRLDLITDGDSQGPDPVAYAKIFRDLGIHLNLIQTRRKSHDSDARNSLAERRQVLARAKRLRIVPSPRMKRI